MVGSRRRAARQIANRLGGNAGDRGRPLRALGQPIVEAEQIASESVEAGAVARDELRIVAFLDSNVCAMREHERGVGVRAE